MILDFIATSKLSMIFGIFVIHGFCKPKSSQEYAVLTLGNVSKT